MKFPDYCSHVSENSHHAVSYEMCCPVKTMNVFVSITAALAELLLGLDIGII